MRIKKKTHRGAAKRFKLTASGRVWAPRAGYHHKQTKKRKQYRRQARRGHELTGAEARKIREMLT